MLFGRSFGIPKCLKSVLKSNLKPSSASERHFDPLGVVLGSILGAETEERSSRNVSVFVNFSGAFFLFLGSNFHELNLGNTSKSVVRVSKIRASPFFSGRATEHFF